MFQFLVPLVQLLQGKCKSLTNEMHVLFSTVTVQCTRDGQFVVVVAQAATLPHIDVDSISLLETNGPSCTPIDFTSAFAIFQFPVTACGTTIKVGYNIYCSNVSLDMVAF